MRFLRSRGPYSPTFIAPGLLIYLVFFIIPTTISIYYSFTDWNTYLDKVTFVWFDNFKRIFTDRVIKHAISNTFIFAIVSTIGKNVIGLLFALALTNRSLRFLGIWRSIFFLPVILSSIVVGLLFTAILHPEGLLNESLQVFGLDFLTQQWLVDRHIVMYAVSGVEVWQWAGFHMIIFLAGLQSIPRQFYEAALVDGANAWRKFRHITMPLILPAFNVSLVVALIGGFKVFAQVYVLTGGGPGYASQVIYTMVFQKLGEGQWGLGTAMNLVLTIAIALVAYTILHFLQKREVEM